MKPRSIDHIAVTSAKIAAPVTFALAADLHNGPWEDLTPHLARADAILILGDLVNRHRKGYDNAVDFLCRAPDLAPTFYAIGNHEWKFPQRDEYWPHVEESRVTVLDNTYTRFQGVVLGALSSARKQDVDPAFLASMERQPGFRLLMCHHPEYYARYIKGHAIDLTLSGHAHGGQVRLGSQGVYAPGQWLFPKLTSGFYEEGQLLVSRGLTNSAHAPRLNNPCQLILLHLNPKEA